MPAVSSAVALVLLDEHQRALLVRDGPERWRLPGGAVREGETPAATARREAVEEICAEIELDHLIALYELRGKLSGLRYVYAVRLAAGEEIGLPEGDDILEWAWFAADALPAQMTTVAPWGVQDAITGSAGLLRTIET